MNIQTISKGLEKYPKSQVDNYIAYQKLQAAVNLIIKGEVKQDEPE